MLMLALGWELLVYWLAVVLTTNSALLQNVKLSLHSFSHTSILYCA